MAARSWQAPRRVGWSPRNADPDLAAQAALSSHKVDTTKPSLVSAAAEGTTLTLTFSENLNITAPASTSFTVKVDGATGTNPTDTSVSGAEVTLTLVRRSRHLGLRPRGEAPLRVPPARGAGQPCRRGCRGGGAGPPGARGRVRRDDRRGAGGTGGVLPIGDVGGRRGSGGGAGGTGGDRWLGARLCSERRRAVWIRDPSTLSSSAQLPAVSSWSGLPAGGPSLLATSGAMGARPSPYRSWNG